MNWYRHHRDGEKPKEYADVLSLIEQLGVAPVLRCISAYAKDQYEAASEVRREQNEAEEEKLRDRKDFFVLPQRETTQQDREVYRWMYLQFLDDAASDFEEQTRIAAMSNEALEEETRPKAIAEAEKFLADAKAGKRNGRCF